MSNWEDNELLKEALNDVGRQLTNIANNLAEGGPVDELAKEPETVAVNVPVRLYADVAALLQTLHYIPNGAPSPETIGNLLANPDLFSQPVNVGADLVGASKTLAVEIDGKYLAFYDLVPMYVDLVHNYNQLIAAYQELSEGYQRAVLDLGDMYKLAQRYFPDLPEDWTIRDVMLAVLMGKLNRVEPS